MVVVIPAYQPDEKLLGVVQDFRTHAPDFPIIIVNDGSSTSCKVFFDELKTVDNVVVLEHPVNKGKGAALKTAFTYVNDHYPVAEGIITVDADGQHLIEDSLRVCESWKEHRDQIVTGSRRFTGKVPVRSRIGNSITRGIFRLTTGRRIYDTQTGLRAFSVSRVPEMLSLSGDRYEYEINQLLNSCTKGTGVFEVPINTVYIDENKSSHFNTIRDSIKIYKVILKYLAPTFLKFLSSSLLSFLIDIIGFIILFYGVVTICAGWDTARALFSFLPVSSGNAFESLEKAHPIIFAAGGGYLRVVSLVIARIVSSVANYYLNKRFVFDAHHLSTKSTFIKYAVVAVIVLALNALFLELFTALGIPAWLSNALSQIVCYPVSFCTQRIFVFKKGKDLRSNA